MAVYTLGDNLPIKMSLRDSTKPLIDKVDGDSVVLRYSYEGGHCILSTTKQFIKKRYDITIE